MEKFKTIEKNATAEIEEKRSKFIASIFYVQNVEEAENILKQTKKKYYDARHNCYAYIVRDNGIIKKSSDDGEPSGTAGSPILNVLEKNSLCNVLVIVTRYFGGILLGTGGLVRAYTEATTKVIELSKIIEQEEGVEIEIIIPYQDFQKLKHYCDKNKIKITNVVYNENISCNIELTNKEKEMLLYNENKDRKNMNILEYRIIKNKYIRK